MLEFQRRNGITFLPVNRQDVVKPNFSKRNHSPQTSQQVQLNQDKRAAVKHFLRHWFIIRRDTAAGSADKNIIQQQPIAAAGNNRLVGKSGPVEGGVKKFSR